MMDGLGEDEQLGLANSFSFTREVQELQITHSSDRSPWLRSSHFRTLALFLRYILLSDWRRAALCHDVHCTSLLQVLYCCKSLEVRVGREL